MSVIICNWEDKNMVYQIISIVLLVVTVIVSLLSYYLYIRGKILAAAAGAINDSEIDDVERRNSN